MDEFLFCKNKEYNMIINIDLDDEKYKIFNPEYLPIFNAEELIRINCGFPGGIYPGAREINSQIDENNTFVRKQISKIYRFPNYLEFSKIMEDEVIKINGENYITNVFFNRRKEGWSNINLLSKKGNLIGYCFNGILYHSDETEHVKQVVYKTIYYLIISKNKEFEDIKDILSRGDAINLKGSNKYFLEAFSEILKNIIHLL